MAGHRVAICHFEELDDPNSRLISWRGHLGGASNPMLDPSHLELHRMIMLLQQLTAPIGQVGQSPRSPVDHVRPDPRIPSSNV